MDGIAAERDERLAAFDVLPRHAAVDLGLPWEAEDPLSHLSAKDLRRPAFDRVRAGAQERVRAVLRERVALVPRDRRRPVDVHQLGRAPLVVLGVVDLRDAAFGTRLVTARAGRV